MLLCCVCCDPHLLEHANPEASSEEASSFFEERFARLRTLGGATVLHVDLEGSLADGRVMACQFEYSYQ